MDLQEIKKYAESLDLKKQEDFDSWKQIKSDLFLNYKDELSRGRCEAGSIIDYIEEGNYSNYPTMGYEVTYISNKWKNYKFKNYAEFQYFIDECNLKVRCCRLFGLDFFYKKNK